LDTKNRSLRLLDVSIMAVWCNIRKLWE